MGEEKGHRCRITQKRIICDESESSVWSEWVAKKIKFKHKRIARRFAAQKTFSGDVG
jgi:hypothetical protein